MGVPWRLFGIVLGGISVPLRSLVAVFESIRRTLKVVALRWSAMVANQIATVAN